MKLESKNQKNQKVSETLVKEAKQNKAEILSITDQLSILQDKNEDLRNHSMRLTLNFCGIPEDEQNGSLEMVTKYLTNSLAKKLNLDCYELHLQISRTHHTPKTKGNFTCRVIFAQFVNQHYADDIRRGFIELHTAKQSQITASQMLAKRLTKKRNDALRRRKEILEEDLSLTISLEYQRS